MSKIRVPKAMCLLARDVSSYNHNTYLMPIWIDGSNELYIESDDDATEMYFINDKHVGFHTLNNSPVTDYYFIDLDDKAENYS